MNIKQNELTAADMATQTGKLSEQITQPISGSKKIYIEGSRPDIRVPMREIEKTGLQNVMIQSNSKALHLILVKSG